MWNLKDLVKITSQNHTQINGRWVSARPLNLASISWKNRLKDAWEVLKGRADAVRWPENQ